MITTDKPAASTGTGRLITLWILSALVALAFIAAGGGKVAGTAVMVELFDNLGLGQWFRYFTGLLEIVGAIGADFPLRFLCSRPAGHRHGWRIIAHVTVLGGSPAPAVALLVLSGLIAYLRKP